MTELAKSPTGWTGTLPVSLFSASLGYAGLATAWRQASDAYGAPSAIADLILICGLIVFGGLVASQIRRYLSDPSAIAAEFRDPVSASFFATFSMSVLALAGAMLTYSPVVSTVLWIVGAVTQFALAVAIIARWFERDCDVTFVNPGWFLPSAGNLLAPITGRQLGFEELSWFFFAVGFVFWVILFVILLYRVIFLGPFPARLNPTLFIFLAPPSLAALALGALTGEMDTIVGKVLFYIAVFFAVLLTALWRRFRDTPFSPTWWSCTFPTAALATVAMQYADATQTAAAHVIGLGSLAFCTAAVVIISVLTARAIRAGTLVPAPGSQR